MRHHRRGRGSPILVIHGPGSRGEVWRPVRGALLGPALPGLMRTRAGRSVLCGLFYARPAELAPADCLGDARALIRAPGFAAARRSIGGWRMNETGAGVPVTG